MLSRATLTLPLPVRRALRKLGEDIRAARRRRAIPTELMAERAFTTRTTLRKIERGDPSVALGTYATVLFVLGMTDRLRDLADSTQDKLGIELADEQLPQRIRKKREPSSADAP
jgi:transcriptional regulator with XRE-family HTH domain